MSNENLNIHQFKNEFPEFQGRISNFTQNYDRLEILLKEPEEKLTVKLVDDILKVTNRDININSKILTKIINTYKKLQEEKELEINELKEKIIYTKMINEEICISPLSYKLDVYDIDKLELKINDIKEEISKIKKTINHIKTNESIIEKKEYL